MVWDFISHTKDMKTDHAGNVVMTDKVAITLNVPRTIMEDQIVGDLDRTLTIIM